MSEWLDHLTRSPRVVGSNPNWGSNFSDFPVDSTVIPFHLTGKRGFYIKICHQNDMYDWNKQRSELELHCRNRGKPKVDIKSGLCSSARQAKLESNYYDCWPYLYQAIMKLDNKQGNTLNTVLGNRKSRRLFRYDLFHQGKKYRPSILA